MATVKFVILASIGVAALLGCGYENSRVDDTDGERAQTTVLTAEPTADDNTNWETEFEAHPFASFSELMRIEARNGTLGIHRIDLRLPDNLFQNLNVTTYILVDGEFASAGKATVTSTESTVGSIYLAMPTSDQAIGKQEGLVSLVTYAMSRQYPVVLQTTYDDYKFVSSAHHDGKLPQNKENVVLAFLWARGETLEKELARDPLTPIERPYDSWDLETIRQHAATLEDTFLMIVTCECDTTGLDR